MEVLLLAAAFVAVLGAVLYQFCGKSTKQEHTPLPSPQSESESKKAKPKPAKVDVTAQLKQTKAVAATGDTSDHALLAFVLKGHQAPIREVKFSMDNQYLVSCSEDRTIRVWLVNSLGKNKDPTYVRINTQLDFATACAVSADSRYVVAAMEDSKKLVVYELSQNKDKSAKTPFAVQETIQFPSGFKDPVHSLLVAPNNAYVLAAVRGTDTHVRLFSLKGDLIHSFNTNQLLNHLIRVSPDGKFIIAATMLGDVRLWEVKFGKSNDFAGTALAMDLKGHKKGVFCVDFSKDCKTVITGSMDGYLRSWNIAVRYQQQEDSKMKWQVKTPFDSVDHLVYLNSAEGKDDLIAAAHKNTLQFFSAATGEALDSIENVHTGHINSVSASGNGKAVVTCGDDKIVRVWTNPRAVKAK